MRSIIKNKKGQFGGILTFCALTVGILILAPIMLKIIGTVLTSTSDSIKNQTIQDAATGNATAALDYGNATFTKFWDIIIVVFFFLNIVILLVSSFMIDVHPAFWVIYLVMAFIFFIISPAYVKAIDAIWTDSNFAGEVSNLTNTSWIYSNYNLLMLGIYFITGIVIFAKIRGNK